MFKDSLYNALRIHSYNVRRIKYYLYDSKLPRDLEFVKELLVEDNSVDRHIAKRYFPNHKNMEEAFILHSPSKGKDYIIMVNVRYSYRNGYDYVSVAHRRYYSNNIIPKKRKRKCSFIPPNINIPKNGCQIYSLSVILQKEPKEVLNWMRKHGWNEDRTGNMRTNNRWKKILAKYGKYFTLRWDKHRRDLHNVDNVSGMNVTTAVKKFNNGTYVISVRQHICTIVDGVLYDCSSSELKQVLRIYEIHDY